MTAKILQFLFTVYVNRGNSYFSFGLHLTDIILTTAPVLLFYTEMVANHEAENEVSYYIINDYEHKRIVLEIFPHHTYRNNGNNTFY